jgi:anti-sigma B factor antagonist
MATSPALRRTLLDALPRAAVVAVNLKAIRYIDSSGIASLIEVLKDSQRRNTEFILFGLGANIKAVFELTHVVRIFKIFETEEEALLERPPALGNP